MSRYEEIKDTDWRLYMCNQETGTDFLNEWGPESEMRESMAREANWGRDVWLIAPDGSKVLPEVAAKQNGIQDHKPKIAELVSICEESHAEMRKRWPDTKDPEKHEMELVMYHVANAIRNLQALLGALK